MEEKKARQTGRARTESNRNCTATLLPEGDYHKTGRGWNSPRGNTGQNPLAVAMGRSTFEECMTSGSTSANERASGIASEPIGCPMDCPKAPRWFSKISSPVIGS